MPVGGAFRNVTGVDAETPPIEAITIPADVSAGARSCATAESAASTGTVIVVPEGENDPTVVVNVML